MELRRRGAGICQAWPVRLPRRAHHWFVIIWLAITLVGAVVLAMSDEPNDVDQGNSILLAFFLVLGSLGLLGYFILMFLRYRKERESEASSYGLWDFIKEPPD